MIDIEILAKDETVKLPEYATHGAAGFDLYADNFKVYDSQLKEVKLITREDGSPAQGLKLRPGYRVLVGTGIKVAVPEGFEMQIRPRSGLALKQGITVLNSPGTVDSDYRGEVGIIIINNSHDEVILNKGDALGQGVVAQVERANFKSVKELSPTKRGEGGFGSTTK